MIKTFFNNLNEIENLVYQNTIKIAEKMIAHGINQDDIAKCTGMSKEAVNNLNS